MSLVADPANIRLGIAGKVDENDHPYSWAAILNGYEPQAMQRYAVPVIAHYLGAADPAAFGFPGVRVTHIWCDRMEDARRVAEASRITHVVETARDLIGRVDAVLIPTDRGEEHAGRAKPFVEAGIPVFIDKPLCNSLEDLAVFRRWIDAGRPILSCSAMRYAAEFESLRHGLPSVGDIRLITMTMVKSWRRYGIHALEAVYPFLPQRGGERRGTLKLRSQELAIGANGTRISSSGSFGRDIVHIRHESGVDVVLAVIDDLSGGSGVMHVYGTNGQISAQFRDSFTAFKRQLAGFIEYLRTGRPPFGFDQTEELISLLIAGERARDTNVTQVLQMT